MYMSGLSDEAGAAANLAMAVKQARARVHAMMVPVDGSQAHARAPPLPMQRDSHAHVPPCDSHATCRVTGRPRNRHATAHAAAHATAHVKACNGMQRHVTACNGM